MPEGPPSELTRNAEDLHQRIKAIADAVGAPLVDVFHYLAPYTGRLHKRIAV
jgi:hypothetical protein